MQCGCASMPKKQEEKSIFSPEGKDEWLKEMGTAFPVGCKVRVVDSDLDEYIGVTGNVADYRPGSDTSWPLIGVVFDTPIRIEGQVNRRDGFYDEELERL